MKTMIKIVRESFCIYRKFPATITPLILSALLNACALYILYLAPQRPISFVLAPPIRVFLGEKFLHYPYNIFKLGSLFEIANILISATIGLILTGAALIMIHDASQGNLPKMAKAAMEALHRYMALFLMWFIMFLAPYFYLRSEIKNPLFNIFHTAPFAAEALSYFIFTLIQIIFLYAIASFLINKTSIIKAFKKAFGILKLSIVPTVLVALVALSIYFFTSLLLQKLDARAQFFSPDVIVWVLNMRIVFAFFIDCFITFSAVWIFRAHSH